MYELMQEITGLTILTCTCIIVVAFTIAVVCVMVRKTIDGDW